MQYVGWQEVTTAALAVTIILGRKKLAPVLGSAIQDLLDGGPRPPSHPLLGNDSPFLIRRRRRATPEIDS